MLGLGPDRKILGVRLQRGLFVAGAHPARPRHPRRLRPAQVGDRKALGPGTPDAARHGDDGLTDLCPCSRILVIARSVATKQSRLPLWTHLWIASLRSQ